MGADGMMMQGDDVASDAGEAAGTMSGHEMMHEMMEHMMGGNSGEAHGHDNQRSKEKTWSYMNPMMGGSGWLGGFRGIGMVFGLLFWILVIAALFAAVKWLFVKTSGSAGRGSQEAVEILKERYARGEIDKKEFEERLNAVRGA
jgi:putative membrane protein